MNWGIFFAILGGVGLAILLGCILFFVFCAVRVGADSERKKPQTVKSYKTDKLNNEVRVIKKFLLFPRKINNEHKWLKVAYIVQAHKIFGYDGDMWFNVRWSTVNEYESFKILGVFKITQQEIDQAWEDYCRL